MVGIVIMERQLLELWTIQVLLLDLLLCLIVLVLITHPQHTIVQTIK